MKDILRLRAKNFALDLTASSVQVSPHLCAELSDQLLSGVPFPYLLSESEFFGRKFYVGPDVLIPRPETELLVDLIIQKKKHFDCMADVGVGSGVILLSLLAEKIAKRGVGFDLSNEALHIAQINATNLRIQNAEFILSDRLSKAQSAFDLIVSNPPYIKSDAHRTGVHPGVDQYEPSLALYIPDAEYEEWFRVFFRQVFESLSSGGEFYMEGHEAELQVQSDWLRETGLREVEVIQDWTKRNRFIFARKA